MVIKLSKLTVACPVYRGLKDAALPPEFWEANEFNVRGIAAVQGPLRCARAKRRAGERMTQSRKV